eukprot:6188398-Pleurochrysis_carterae.AAC.1
MEQTKYRGLQYRSPRCTKRYKAKYPGRGYWVKVIVCQGIQDMSHSRGTYLQQVWQIVIAAIYVIDSPLAAALRAKSVERTRGHALFSLASHTMASPEPAQEIETPAHHPRGYKTTRGREKV